MLKTKRRPSRSISESQRFSRSNMKKTFIGPLVSVFVLILLAAAYFYMNYQVNRQIEQMDTLQTTIAQDSQTVSSLVNFINTSLQNTQQQ